MVNELNKEYLEENNIYTKQTENELFTYLDMGQGPIIVLLHGLMGAWGNWSGIIHSIGKKYRIIIPSLPLKNSNYPTTISGLVTFLKSFLEAIEIKKFNCMGNSLGGHIALLYAIQYPEEVENIILTGSSGLFENTMGSSFPKLRERKYIQHKTTEIFYDTALVTEEMVDSAMDVVADSAWMISIIRYARSAQLNNVANQLHQITANTLLIWGLNDVITPTHVAHEFNRKIPNSTLRFIDKCGHAPMMEHPEVFQEMVLSYLTMQHESSPH